MLHNQWLQQCKYISNYFHAKRSGDIHFGPEKWKEKKQKRKTCSSMLYALCIWSIMKKETSFFKCFYFYFYELNMKKETSNYYTRLLETKGNKNENLVKKLVTIILLQLVCLLLRFFLFGGRAKNRLLTLYMYLTICVDILYYYYKQ